MAQKLNDIKACIKDELSQFEKHFKQSMKTDVALLDKITSYIVKRKGKQMRPMFVFLSAKVCGEINKSSFDAAALVELLHTGTLVHDDIVDDSHYRRGFFSINALWKNKAAVLVGDYLLSKGFLLALDNNHFRHLQILSVAIKEMSEGELLQLEKARKLDIEEDIYFDIIRRKTASLIAAACSVGAASTTDDEELIQKMKDFGETIGIAFQIKDDLFDYGEKDIGKPRGIDIKEKKMTLPLIYALNQSTSKEKKHIINIIKRHNEDSKKVKEVIEFVKAKGGLEYGHKIMIEYKDKALKMLEDLPRGEANDALHNLVEFVIARKK